MTVEIQDAEHQLSKLAESAANGEDVILLVGGKPLARIVSLDEKRKRKLGTLAGMYKVPDDIDTMFAKDIEEMFYGREDH